MRTTIFSWGYHGWGGATTHFVQAVDAVERSRGFEPPWFVDIRIRREVRAKGFIGEAFAKVAGIERYIWMKELGNRCIAMGVPGIQIDRPAAARDLMLRAMKAADQRRRLLFFCSCRWPLGNPGDHLSTSGPCHRHDIAELIIKYARMATPKVEVEVIEWPGGGPITGNLTVLRPALQELRRGRKSICVSPDSPTLFAQWWGLPWGSTVSVQCGDEILHVVSGPATYHRGRWQIPVLGIESSLQRACSAGVDFRHRHGLDPRH
jgi:hypothetical protein